jgi:hypothetical protein
MSILEEKIAKDIESYLKELILELQILKRKKLILLH